MSSRSRPAKAAISLPLGFMRYVTGSMPKGHTVIDTPTATMTLRGTNVAVAVNQKGETLLVVDDGEVTVRSKLTGQEMNVGAGSSIDIKPEEIRKYFEIALNTNKPRTATLNSSEALVVDDTTVIVTGFDTVTGVKDGQPVIGMGRVTFVVAKRGSDWLIVHLHRSPLPAT